MMNLNKGNQLYVSPELFKILKSKNKFNNDINKSDIFSLGLTILNAGINENINLLYDK